MCVEIFFLYKGKNIGRAFWYSLYRAFCRLYHTCTTNAQYYCYYNQQMHNIVIKTNKCTILLLLQPTSAQYCYYKQQLHNIVITTNKCTILLLLQPTCAQYCCFYNQQMHDIFVITTNKCTILLLLQPTNAQYCCY